MPLEKRGKGCVSKNIRELTGANEMRTKKRTKKQIAAIALDACGKSRKKKGRK